MFLIITAIGILGLALGGFLGYFTGRDVGRNKLAKDFLEYQSHHRSSPSDVFNLKSVLKSL